MCLYFKLPNDVDKLLPIPENILDEEANWRATHPNQLLAVHNSAKAYYTNNFHLGWKYLHINIPNAAYLDEPPTISTPMANFILTHAGEYIAVQAPDYLDLKFHYNCQSIGITEGFFHFFVDPKQGHSSLSQLFAFGTVSTKDNAKIYTEKTLSCVYQNLLHSLKDDDWYFLTANSGQTLSFKVIVPLFIPNTTHVIIGNTDIINLCAAAQNIYMPHYIWDYLQQIKTTLKQAMNNYHYGL